MSVVPFRVDRIFSDPIRGNARASQFQILLVCPLNFPTNLLRIFESCKHITVLAKRDEGDAFLHPCLL